MKNFFQLCNVLFFLCALQASAARRVDRTRAVVNNEAILESDVDAFVTKMRSKSYQELFGGFDSKALGDRNAALRLLIEEKLINQQVKKLELEATPQEVDAQIRLILKRNNITQGQLSERLKDLGTSMADYREGIQRQLERKNLIDREIKPSLEVSEEQLKHFYLRSTQPGELETEYRIAHILISAGPDAAIRAAKVHKEVVATPSEFEKFVVEYSDDESTHESGGAIGYFSKSSLASEFRKVVPTISVGGITNPIQTKAGFHIIKVLDKRAQGFDSLPKERKDAIRNQMIGEELDKKMALWLERKKTESHIRISEDK